MTHTDQRLTAPSHWLNPLTVAGIGYRCGYCSSDVGSGSGYSTERDHAIIRICPRCNGPSFFGADSSQWPGPKIGLPVTNVSEDVRTIYEEARSSISANAFTGAVMLCRKILMHVAVEKGAKANLSFQQYVKWLIQEHYVPRGAEGWLDYIRARGNEANHEIVVMNKNDATGVLLFTEALLRGVYELPGLVPAIAEQAEESEDVTEVG